MARTLRNSSRLVGQPLLYAISVFASLGVFLVSFAGDICSPIDAPSGNGKLMYVHMRI